MEQTGVIRPMTEDAPDNLEKSLPFLADSVKNYSIR